MTTPQHDDRGFALTMFLVVFTFTMLIMTGMVADGGRILSGRRAASNAAHTAARVGAQAFEIDNTIGYRFDTVKAEQLAGAYLDDRGYPSHSVHASCDNVCTVTVSVDHTVTMVLLQMIGRPTKTVTVTASAHPAVGIQREGDS